MDLLGGIQGGKYEFINNIYNSGSIGAIDNRGTIGNICNDGSIITISNNGTITSIINNNANSVVTVNNNNTIDSINTVKNVSINNSGLIKNIVTGSGGTANVYNTGLINGIYIGTGGVLDGNNTGFVEKVSSGPQSRTTTQWYNTSSETKILMDNEFIRNYFLTTDELRADIGVSRIDGKLHYDITAAVTSALKRDVGEFEANKGNNPWFASKVGNEGPWNLKYRNDKDGIYHWESTLNIPFWGYSTQMVLNGRLVTVEQVGRISFDLRGGCVQPFRCVQAYTA